MDQIIISDNCILIEIEILKRAKNCVEWKLLIIKELSKKSQYVLIEYRIAIIYI